MSKKEPKMSWYYLTPEERVDYLIYLYEQIPDTTINQDEKQHNINKYSNSEFESGDDEGYGIVIKTLEQIIATQETLNGGKKSRKQRKSRKSRKSKKSKSRK